jgi:hypothetical protein
MVLEAAIVLRLFFLVTNKKLEILFEDARRWV